jgi:hypothetical protein
MDPSSRGVPHRGAAIVFGLIASTSAGCGSNRTASPVGEVGIYEDGGVFESSDASAGEPLDAYIAQSDIAVKVVTLSCAGACAMVQAVGIGGHPPYTFAWDDGTTGATRRLCPSSSATYDVAVTDTATTGEIARAASTAHASVTADVLACPDAGSPPDASPDATASTCAATAPLLEGCETISLDFPAVSQCPFDATQDWSYHCLPQPLAAGHTYRATIASTGVFVAGDPEEWTAAAGPADCSEKESFVSDTVSASGDVNASGCTTLTADAPAVLWDIVLEGTFHATTSPNPITVQICEGCGS